MESSRLPATAVVNLIVMVSLAFMVTPVFSQNQNKTVEWSKSPMGSNYEKVAANLLLSRQIEGVEIEDIAVAGRSIIVGEPFAA